MNNGGWGTSRIKRVNDCHPERRHYANGLCLDCYRNTPVFRAARRAYYLANRAQWVEHNRKQKERRVREAKRYGISPDDQRRMLAEQRGLCALCGDPPKRRGLAIDHCHASGRVRAFLCHSCNNALGLLKDDPALCERAAAYLRDHSVRAAAVPARGASAVANQTVRGAGLPSPLGKDGPRG